MKNTLLGWILKRKGLLLAFFATTLCLCFFSTNGGGVEVGQKALIDGTDTCTIQHQNFWTGNFRVVDGTGKEFSVKPENVLFVDAIADYQRIN